MNNRRWKGALNTNETFSKSPPRANDVKSSVDRWTMPALHGAGFVGRRSTRTKGRDVMVMGDPVLFSYKVNPL